MSKAVQQQHRRRLLQREEAVPRARLRRQVHRIAAITAAALASALVSVASASASAASALAASASASLTLAVVVVAAVVAAPSAPEWEE